jgi:hypothetical protein
MRRPPLRLRAGASRTEGEFGGMREGTCGKGGDGDEEGLRNEPDDSGLIQGVERAERGRGWEARGNLT